MEVKASRFLAEGFPLYDSSEVRKVLKAQKQKYKTASHVVHAFSIGTKAEILGSSDDGEPAGTSGPAALTVIRSKNITNTLVTITRWFGGTLLGTGGLVKAYSSATKSLLENARLEEIIEKRTIEITLDYAEYHILERSLSEQGFVCEAKEFSAKVMLKGWIAEKNFESFRRLLLNATNGRLVL